MSRAELQPLDPKTYRRHPLHDGTRDWPETNCFVDLWIEILHAYGLEPLAALGCALDLDFEGDQFTFFKQSPGDLAALYGADIQELNVWRPLPQHALEFLRQKRLVLTEVDAFWLPDTAGTDYRSHHIKSTIGIQSIDLDGDRLGYFHNAGYFELSGADFRGLFGLDALDPTRLPLYCEFVRLESFRVLPPDRLVAAAGNCTRAHLARRPRENPVGRFAATFPDAVGWLTPGQLPTYHLYAFATLRQLGSAADMGAHHLRWLQSQGFGDLEAAAAALAVVSNGSKSLILKGARAVVTGKRGDFAPLLDEITRGWSAAMDGLSARFGV